MPGPGDIIAERYRLEERLGKGAMGAVWRAQHVTLTSPVAIKLIRREAARDERSLARFEREAVLAAKIRSAHVVQVLDHGHQTGLPYIVMEYLEGEDLRQRLEQRKRLDIAETAAIVKQVCRALTAAHAVGLVHRDIKPENIFLTPGEDDDQEDIVKVLDFGIAKVSDELALVGMDPTRTGALIGTPYYLSPEQARGLKSVGPSADIWSLGVVAFECLTGVRPFSAPAMGPLIAKITQGEIPKPSQFVSDLPSNIDDWMAQVLARDPAQRFGSPKALSSAFLVAAEIGDSMPVTRDSSLNAAAFGDGKTMVLPSNEEAAVPTWEETLALEDPAKTVALSDSGEAPSMPVVPPPVAIPTPNFDSGSDAAGGKTKLSSGQGASRADRVDGLAGVDTMARAPWPEAPPMKKTPVGLVVALIATSITIIGVVLFWLLTSKSTGAGEPPAEPTAAPSEPASGGPASEPSVAATASDTSTATATATTSSAAPTATDQSTPTAVPTTPKTATTTRTKPPAPPPKPTPTLDGADDL